MVGGPSGPTGEQSSAGLFSFICTVQGMVLARAGLAGRTETMADEETMFTQAQVDESEAGLKANRAAALDEAKNAKAALRAMEQKWGDLDVDAVRQMLADQESEKGKQAKDAGDWEAREKQLTDAHAAERLKDASVMKKQRAAIDNSLVDAELTRAIAAQKGDVELLLPHARRYVQVRETETGYESFVVDENGHEAVSDGQGAPMTMDQLVETRLVGKYARAFDSTGSSGSGASKSAAGGAGQKVVSYDDSKGYMDNLEGIANGTIEVR